MSGSDEVRILYVGGTETNGLEKRQALRELGASIESFDLNPYTHEGPRLLRTVAHRLNTGPPVERMNRDLLAFASELRDIALVWIDKGRWLRHETLRRVRDALAAPLAHFANDAMLVHNESRHFRRSIPLYDVHFTTKRFELERYRAAGARAVRLVANGIDGHRFRPPSLSEEQRRRFGSDVVFVGRCEPHYARCLRAVADTGVRLRIWGPRWPRYARLHAWARRAVSGDGVFGDDYPRALAAGRVGLGLLSKHFPETVTTRSLEIPACGTFLLAERTEEHEELFREGEEAEFFGSESELLRKLRHYLEHDDERQRIAAAGRRRFEESGYSNVERYRRMLAELGRLTGALRLDARGRVQCGSRDVSAPETPSLA